MTDIRDDLLAAVEKWRAEVSRLTAALAESDRRRVEMIDRHEAERRVLAADVCRQADRAEAAEKEAERQRMFWEGIRDARVDAAECSLVGARAMADDFRRRAEEHATLQAAAERDRDALKAEVEQVTSERDEWRRRIGCRPSCTLQCCDQDCDNSGVEDPDGRSAWDLLDDARASTLRWYRADGTYEVLGSPEEVVERRKEAAKVLASASALRERADRAERALEEVVDRASGDVRVDGLPMATPQRVEQSIREALSYVSEPARSLLAAAPPHEETSQPAPAFPGNDPERKDEP